MNTLSMFLYFAEVLSSVGIFLGIIGLIGLIFGIVISIPSFIVPWNYHASLAPPESVEVSHKNLKIFSIVSMVFGFVFFLTSVFLPSKQTMYMIAASELGETVVTSEEGREIYTELKSIIMENLRSTKLPGNSHE